MPAAAVIPAPRAYINVVAVKKPVVGFEIIAGVRPHSLAVVDPAEHITVMVCLHAGTDVGRASSEVRQKRSQNAP